MDNEFMTVYMIWVKEDDIIWLADSMDDATMDATASWGERVEKAYKDWGAENVRITTSKLHYPSIQQAFGQVEIPVVSND